MKDSSVSVFTIAIVCLLFASGVSRADTEQTAAETRSLRVMTFNVLRGGMQRGQPLSQTAKVIQAAEADIVGLQEVGGKAKELAALLGWNYMRHGSGAILTRFEIIEKHDGGARIRLESGQDVYLFNLHLAHAPYQPYQLLGIPYADAPFIKTEREAVDSAEGARGQQIAGLFGKIGKLPDKEIPVFVTGDFNEPSHLDWTAAAAKAGRHPIKVAYPSSMAMVEKGFMDAWRAFHPDEMKSPGYTWTPVTQAADPKDHHDRIDFVYFRGKRVEVKNVSIVGEDKENADIVVSPFPSDHRAVVATFLLPPA